VLAIAPATKLHKDSSGDVHIAATVTAVIPTDTAKTAATAQPTQVDFQAVGKAHCT